MRVWYPRGMNDAERELYEFLSQRFNEHELRILLAGTGGDRLIIGLPGGTASRAEIAHAGISELKNRGLIDHPFFDLMGKDREKLKPEVERLREQFLGLPRMGPGAAWCSGRYRLEEQVGKGGYGYLWRALDTYENKAVALKILNEQSLLEPTLRQRFVRGAEELANHTHPNIARVLTPPSREKGRLYYVMEFVEGESLECRIGKAKRFELAAAVPIIRAIGGALECLHSKGIVHRDVKPGNVILGAEGTPKLVDFDLVHVDHRERLTSSRTPGASLLYVAPELRAPGARTTPAADVYGLAMTLISMRIGRDPELSEVMGGVPRLIEAAELTPACAKAVARALEPQVTQRTSTVSAFLSELTAPPLRRVPVLLSCLTLSALLLAVAWSLFLPTQARTIASSHEDEVFQDISSRTIPDAPASLALKIPDTSVPPKPVEKNIVVAKSPRDDREKPLYEDEILKIYAPVCWQMLDCDPTKERCYAHEKKDAEVPFGNPLLRTPTLENIQAWFSEPVREIRARCAKYAEPRTRVGVSFMVPTNHDGFIFYPSADGWGDTPEKLRNCADELIKERKYQNSPFKTSYGYTGHCIVSVSLKF